jgi:hypothetical protein
MATDAFAKGRNRCAGERGYRRPIRLSAFFGMILFCIAAAPLAAQEIKIPDSLGARASTKVNVTLDDKLLQFASKFLADKDEEGEAKKLIAGLKSVFVRTFEYDKEGEYNMADVDAVRAQFRAPAWSRMMGVESKKESGNADVFVMTDKDGKFAGLGVIAVEPKEVTIISIAGAIDPAQFGSLAGKLGIPKVELQKKQKSGKDD